MRSEDDKYYNRGWIGLVTSLVTRPIQIVAFRLLFTNCMDLQSILLWCKYYSWLSNFDGLSERVEKTTDWERVLQS